MTTSIPTSIPPPERFVMSACDKLTMDTMMNMDTYSKCMKHRMHQVLPTTSHQTQADLTERKFYRRRIIDTTKELCKNRDAANVAENTNTSVLTTFDAYIRACIMHFKFIDLADTLQDEYAGLDDGGGGGGGIVNETSSSKIFDLSKLDKLCFNSTDSGEQSSYKTVQINSPSSNSLERLFMVKTEADNKVSDKKNNHLSSSASTSSFLSNLPKIKGVNLMDEQFKMKGVRGKNPKCKKNITCDTVTATTATTAATI